MKTVLILTGPQGAGNHLWSKIFSLHAEVYGWKDLQHRYWLGHDQEPFWQYWVNPAGLANFDWSQSNWYVTSISVPYALNGTLTVPHLEEFVSVLKQQGHAVKIALLGRDRNIVSMQENRVRGQVTLSHALHAYQHITADSYLSYELLHLYGSAYLKNVSSQLQFPVDYNHGLLDQIMETDTNRKYFTAVHHHATDDLARHSSRKWR